MDRARADHETWGTQFHLSPLDSLLDGSEPFLNPDCEQLGVAAPLIPAREIPSFHRLESLDSPAPVCLGYIDIPLGINRQSVGMSKCTDLVTRTPEA